MNRILFMFLAFWVYSLAIGQVSYPQGWGHYPVLAKKLKVPQPGQGVNDDQKFERIPGDTRVNHLERSGENTLKANEKGYPQLTANGGLRKPFYLSYTEPFSIDDPPANSSKQTRAELDFLLQLQSRRSEEDIRASKYFATVYYRLSTKPGDADYDRMQRNLFHIGRSVAPWFNADSLPVTAELVRRLWADASYSLWKCKNYFVRIRPYKLEPDLNNLEETNWAAYPSDSESGRLLGYELIHKLKQNPAFQADFEKAKGEIEAMKRKKG